MIRNLGLVILISLLVATQSMSERAEQSNADEKVVNHFRCSDWGDSIQKVRNSEKILPYSEDKRSELDNAYDLLYKDTLLGRTVYVDYSFFDNKLFIGGYSFKTEYENHSEHVLEDYYKLKLVLTEKYSEPESQKPLDENYLKFSEWKINIKERDTTIRLSIMKKDYSKFHLSVYYYDDKIFDEYMKMLEEQKKRKLDKELNRSKNKL